MATTMNHHRIHPAEFSDAAEIARLNLELGYTGSSEEMARRLKMMLESAHCHVAVAAYGESLMGWIVVERRLTLESGERAEITGLVVATSARRKGIGKALVTAAEQWATQGGLHSIYVRSNILRTESHPFYEDIGYARMKTQHTYEKLLPVATA